MKIKCIKNKCWRLVLTIDKTYDVIDSDNISYKIMNDIGNKDWWYPKEQFKTLAEIRNEKIDKLLA